MTDISKVLNDAELALAAYASLLPGSLVNQRARLEFAGLSAKQAEEFAKKYPIIVAQYNDTLAEGGMGTSFSATVFKDGAGNLNLAIRGTAELIGTPNDLTTDSDIALAGAGYDQIVAMVNWWLRASTSATDTVLQYRIVPGPLDPHAGIQFGTRWLEIRPPVVGTGELAAAITADPDHKLNITGHSLGGHLAMAFGALFPNATNEIAVFNAPGFKTTTANESFFSALGGSIPTGVSTINVIADEARIGIPPWSAIAGLHSRPGTAIDIPIENQWQSDELNAPSAKNHSQQTLTDALAVYALLEILAPAITVDTFKTLLAAAASSTAASLERIVDSLERLLAINNTDLPTGNTSRDILYQAIYALQASGAFRSLSGSAALRLTTVETADSLAQKAKTDFGWFLAVHELLPMAIEGGGSVLIALHSVLYADWQADCASRAASGTNLTFTDTYLADRAAMLAWVMKRNIEDGTGNFVDSGQSGNWSFIDQASRQAIHVDRTSNTPTEDMRRQLAFGTDTANAKTNGIDTLKGRSQDDRLYGLSGTDTLTGGRGADILQGGQGIDTYKFNSGDGADTITDPDGGWIERNGKRLTAASQSATNEWKSPDATYTKSADGKDLLVAFGGGDTLTIKNFDFTAAQGQNAATDARDYGIALKPTKTALLPTLDRRTNPTCGTGEIPTASTTLTEGIPRLLTFFADSASDTVRTIKLTVSDALASLFASTGADLIPFQDGEASLTLAAGQDSLSFALLTRGDIDTNANFNLTASLQDNGNTLATTDLGVALLGTVEAQQSPRATVTDGDQANQIMPVGVAGQPNQNDAHLSPVAIDAGGGNDYVNALGLYDRVLAGAGDDVITGGGDILNQPAGYKTLDGGAGDDVIDSGNGGGLLTGGAGKDLLEGNVQRGFSWAPGTWLYANGQYAPVSFDLAPPGQSPWSLVAPYAHVANPAPATVTLAGGNLLVSGGGWNTDAGGNWALGDQAWYRYSLMGVQGPAGQSPGIAFASGGGSYTLSSGRVVNFTVQGNGTQFHINYTTDGYTNSADGGWTLYGIQDYNMQPHIFDGGDDDDTLIAGSKGDILVGGAGNDLIQGGKGNDTAWGDLGPNSAVTQQAPGNDQIALGDGNDYADGGDGNDLILGEAGSDTLFGGRGDDILIGGKLDAGAVAAGDDYLDGEDGNDTLLGGSGNDELFGGSGNDHLQGDRTLGASGGNDYLDGGDGDDTLLGGGGNDILSGGAGYDRLDGGLGDDAYVIDRGDGSGFLVEDIVDGGGNDVVRFGPGIALDDIDLSLDPGGQGMLVRYGGGDAFLVSGGPVGMIERYEFADGTSYTATELIVLRGDASLAGAANSAGNVVGTRADDLIDSSAGNAMVNPGRGNDRVLLGGNSNTYLYTVGDGTDHVQASGTGNTLRLQGGVTPDDIKLKIGSLAIQVGDDPENVIHLEGFDPQHPMDTPAFGTFQFVEAGSDNIAASLSMAQLLARGFDLDGTDYQDTITGTAVTDRINGFDGDDTLVAGEGNDTINGGYGDDVLDGGAGNDTLDGGEGSDIFLFGRGDGEDTLYQPASGTADHDLIRFKEGVTADDVAISRDYSGLRLTIADSGDSIFIPGLPGDQAMPGVEFADGTTWDGAVFSDVRFLQQGTAGDDYLAGTNDNDLIRGLAGNDYLLGHDGNDQLEGGEGTDDLSGGAGSDVLDGGLGNDNLSGDAGDDVYLFGRGDGTDYAYAYAASGGSDTLRFKPGVAPGDVTLVKYYGSYRLTIDDTGDSIQVSPGVDRVEFADGTVWDAGVLGAAPEYSQGSAGNDFLGGTTGPDYLAGFAGNDDLYGNEGNDVLDGGTGNDALTGGAGNDLFLFGRGDGTDTVYQWSASSGDQDVIRFRAGVLPSDVALTRDTDYAGGVRLTIRETGDSIGIYGYGNPLMPSVQFADGTVWSASQLNSAMTHVVGTAGDDGLYGTLGADLIEGLAGNDTLLGRDGNDTLSGGPGNNYLEGGAGNDVYVIDKDAGLDVIYQYTAAAGDADVVRFGVGVRPENVVRIQSGAELALLDESTGQAVSVVGWDYAQGVPIQVSAVEFADGTVWTGSQLAASPFGNFYDGGDYNDVFGGTDSTDLMLGLSGDDSLSGNAGDDILVGGPGNDYLAGGTGNDTFLVGRGLGSDNIISWDAGADDADTIRFAAGVAPADIDVTRRYGGLYLTIRDTGEKTTIWEWFDRPSVSQVVFADGTVWGRETLAGLSLHTTGTEGDEDLFGGTGNELIQGFGGNDQLFGDAGDDTLVGGTGNDELYGGPGNDTYVFGFGDGQDTLYQYDAQAGDTDAFDFAAEVTPADVVVYRQNGSIVLGLPGSGDSVTIAGWFDGGEGGAPARISARFADGTTWDAATLESRIVVRPGTEFDDDIEGTDTANTIAGLGGNDWILAGGGDDTLDGGPGSDSLAGGAGDDTYVFNRGDGNDRIYNYSDDGLTPLGQDSIRLGAGIAAADVTVSVADSDGDLAVALAIGGGEAPESITVYGGLDQLPQVAFADGTVWDRATLLSMIANTIGADADDLLIGTNGSDVIDGSKGFDVLYGLGGNDTLLGGEDGDRLDGGAGNDLLAGGSGEDWYVINAHSGHDTIVETVDSGDTNGITFGTGLTEADMRFSRTATDLAISFDGADTSVTLKDWFDASAPARIQAIGFDGGEGYWNAAMIEEAAAALAPTDIPLSVSTADRTLLIGDAVAAAELFDVAGTHAPLRYEFWDDVDGGGRFVLEGATQPAGTSIAVAAVELPSLRYVAGDQIATERLWVRAFDGETWTPWAAWNMTSAYHLTNTAPVATAGDITIGLGEAVAAAGLFSISDEEGDAPMKYEFWDDVNGGGRFMLDGVDQAAGTSIAVSADQLASLQYVGSVTTGSERVWVRAYDGQVWSGWTPWNITSAAHPTNEAPVVTAQDKTVLLGQAIDAATLIAVSDADGDAPTKYEFWDDVAGGGYFTKAGIAQDANPIPVSAEELALVQYVAGDATGTERVWARAWDGQAWSGWTPWNMASAPHLTNVAPTVAAADVTVGLGASVQAANLFMVADGDGDAATQYEFWDDVAGGGHFAKGGIAQAAGTTIAVSASELADTTYVGADATATERVWARAWDGQAWSSWTPWNITSEAHATNAAPIVTATAATVGLGASVNASALFSVSDADGDTPMKYEFWDDVNGGGRFVLGGVDQAAGTSIAVSAAQMGGLQYVGGDAIASERVWARAWDGQVWSSWTPWNITSSNHAGNAAPTISASSSGVLAGDAIAAASLFAVSDADGDVATKYELWDDVAGGGHFAKAGVAQAAGTTIAVSAAELAGTTYVGGNANATERLWARAWDGQAWSGWQPWNMTTLSGVRLGTDGADTLAANAGPNFLAGGAGDDTIATGSGAAVVAYNAGDGNDTVILGGDSATLSLGGGIGYQDLALSRSGNDLVLDTGNAESVTFKDWYADGASHTGINLQLIAESMAAFDANSADPLLNAKVQAFDFDALVGRFDAAWAANNAVDHWSVMDSLLQAHLASSDAGALGGDLAYQYGLNGDLANVGMTGARNVLEGSQYGVGIQAFQSLSGLQEGVVKLG